MNMIVGKKQLVLASLVVALGVAVYLNYQFAGEDLDLVTANAQQTTQELSTEEGEQENYGDAQFVDTKEFSSEETQETSLQAESAVGDEEYFSQARMTRTKTRDEAQEALQVMLSDVNLDQEQKDELTAQASAMAQSIETEGKIENLIKAQRAIAEIKADLNGEHPMDRLLCGDVGFGKTEVAMVAAFRMVYAGYQVAVLAPTTVLAQQHFYSFRERFAEYGVNIDMLSRFRSAAEQKTVMERLADGTLDIVIGTHRLCQGDIKFANLGMVIIDAEPRFVLKHI